MPSTFLTFLDTLEDSGSAEDGIPPAEGAQAFVRNPALGRSIPDVRRAGTGQACPEPERYRTWYCPRDGETVIKRVECNRSRDCPACVKLWAYKEGRASEYRLKKVAKKLGLKWQLPRHWVVSRGPEREPSRSAEELSKEYAWFMDLMRKLGVSGGLVVYHGWRHRGSELWFEGAHFHALVWGFLDVSKQPTGVVIKVLEDKDAYQTDVLGSDDLEDPRSLALTVAYMCDHAAIASRRHVVRYFGCASYRKAPGLGKEPIEPIRCPRCGCEMEMLGYEEGWSAICDRVRVIPSDGR